MRENFLNNCGRRSAGTPWPSSETETATWTPSRTAATRMGHDAGEYLAALVRRLFNTWTRRRRSARTRGRSGGRSIWTVCRPPPDRLDPAAVWERDDQRSESSGGRAATCGPCTAPTASTQPAPGHRARCPASRALVVPAGGVP